MIEDTANSNPVSEKKYSRRTALKFIGVIVAGVVSSACISQPAIQKEAVSPAPSEKSPEKGQLIELPKDIMDEKELARRRIKITNLSSYEFYLRKSAVELPVIRRDFKLLSEQKVVGPQGRRSTINKATLDIVLFDNVTLKRQELEKIQDNTVKNDLLNHGLKDFDKGVAGAYLEWNEFKESQEIGSVYDKKIYILIGLGGDPSSSLPSLTPSDDLPRLVDIPKDKENKPDLARGNYGKIEIAMKNLGVWLSLLFRHEVQHYSFKDEIATQTVAEQSLQDAEKRWIEKGEDTGYYFIIKDKRSGVIIRANAKLQTQKEL